MRIGEFSFFLAESSCCDASTFSISLVFSSRTIFGEAVDGRVIVTFFANKFFAFNE